MSVMEWPGGLKCEGTAAVALACLFSYKCLLPTIIHSKHSAVSNWLNLPG